MDVFHVLPYRNDSGLGATPARTGRSVLGSHTRVGGIAPLCAGAEIKSERSPWTGRTALLGLDGHGRNALSGLECSTLILN